jgi:16S rRNA (adenine1518-N6/adenine1519-N6)-dimethyltransferase
MPEEVFDVVDEHDRVTGQAPRSEVHRRGLLHRAVHVFVFNSRGELLVQMRSALKDEFPLHWTSSASGHLGAGETYAEAAPRELSEEVGLSADLEFVAKFPASTELANEHTVLYRATSDQMPAIDASEIERIAWIGLHELGGMLDRDPATFSPPFAYLLKWYRSRGAEIRS